MNKESTILQVWMVRESKPFWLAPREASDSNASSMIGDSSLKQNQISNQRERYFRATERERERERQKEKSPWIRGGFEGFLLKFLFATLTFRICFCTCTVVPLFFSIVGFPLGVNFNYFYFWLKSIGKKKNLVSVRPFFFWLNGSLWDLSTCLGEILPFFFVKMFKFIARIKSSRYNTWRDIANQIDPANHLRIARAVCVSKCIVSI